MTSITIKIRIFTLTSAVIICLGTIYLINTSSNIIATDKEAFNFFVSRFQGYGVSIMDISHIQKAEFPYGQGIYVRFEANPGFMYKLLNNLPNESKPYVAIPCPKPFHESEYTEKWITWWKPEEIVSSKCFVTKICEYFLVDLESKKVYFYEKPGWASSQEVCIPYQKEN